MILKPVLNGILLAGICGSLWVAADPLLRAGRARTIREERPRIVERLTEELDVRYFKKRHYNPSGPEDPAWYGFSGPFPPGAAAPWVSDARWNQIAFRPKDGAHYRYGLYTGGVDAWLLVYGDADGDGLQSRLFRRFSHGRLVQEWQLRPEE